MKSSLKIRGEEVSEGVWLYGRDDVDYLAMNYGDAWLLKLSFVKSVIKEVSNCHYMVRDAVRLNDCVEAEKFCLKMLNGK